MSKKKRETLEDDEEKIKIERKFNADPDNDFVSIAVVVSAKIGVAVRIIADTHCVVTPDRAYAISKALEEAKCVAREINKFQREDWQREKDYGDD